MNLALFGRKKHLYELKPVNKDHLIWTGKDTTCWRGYARSEAEARIHAHEEKMEEGLHEFEGTPEDSPWLLKKYSKCSLIEE